MQEWRADASAMTFDTVSMERSKGFVKALQELKNLRPQLYAAADYCEKSYLHNEQKQIVLENLKDYAVRALVNAVDHVGTVACKLNDLFDQQASEAGTVEIIISSLNQRVLSSQCFIDKDNLRERQFFPVCPRLQKRYILPNCTNKAPVNDNQSHVESIQPSSPLSSAINAPVNGNVPSLSESNQSTIQSRPRPNPPSMAGTKTLLWHLSSDSSVVSDGASKMPWGNADTYESKNSDHPLPTANKAVSSTPSSDHIMRSLLVMDAAVAVNDQSGALSIDSVATKELIHAPLRSKSMLSALFVKNKYPKQKKASVL